MDVKFYRCPNCGNVAIKPFDKGPAMICCGERMADMSANSTDAATEKHVPVVAVDGAAVKVEVGSVAHPMTPEHRIAFICLVTEKGYQVVELSADDEPKAEFALAAGDAAVKVYEYCDLHGLWVTLA
ncbi:MAG: desulfoferrodoxin [Eggerthellaceae bacterium]|jgi:superoxide reductase|nr:desulfoferrodoxin [Eggerthellaceae bacterium]